MRHSPPLWSPGRRLVFRTSPVPWLISTARFKAIDAMRRRARFDGAQRDLVAHMESRVNDAPSGDEEMGMKRSRTIASV